MASRLTADVFKGAIVFSCGRLAAGCEEVGCKEPATDECRQALVGRRANETCGRRFCQRHAMVVDDVLRCGPHARQAMKAKAL